MKWTVAIGILAAVAAGALLFAQQNQPINLSGEWVATGDWLGGGVITAERIRIHHVGNSVVATKLTGDEFVPAGEVTFRGTYSGGKFPVQMQCAESGHVNVQWLSAQVTVSNRDHLKETGGCSRTGDVFERTPTPWVTVRGAPSGQQP